MTNFVSDKDNCGRILGSAPRVLSLIAILCLLQAPAVLRAGVCVGCREFFTIADSAGVWLRDGDPKQPNPTQKRGTLPSLRLGSELLGIYHLLFQDTLVFTGDTNEAGNGVPAGDSVVACTIWITPTSLHFAGVDTIVYDLYSADQAWNENDGDAVSWNNRINGVAWTQPGGSGTLKTASSVRIIRQDATSYKWFTNVNGSLTLWDSVLIASGDSVPIPLAIDLANNIHHGNSYGVLLKLNTTASEIGITHVIASSEEATAAHRVQFQWVSIAVAPQESANVRRRAILQQTARVDNTNSTFHKHDLLVSVRELLHYIAIDTVESVRLVLNRHR